MALWAKKKLTPTHNLTTGTFLSPSHYVSLLPTRVTVQRAGIQQWCLEI
jgi:hypothetical protein